MDLDLVNYKAREEKEFDSDGHVVVIRYTYNEENGSGPERNYSLTITRSDYEKRKWGTKRPTLSYDDYLKVLRPFIMSHAANQEIEQAFEILDFDDSSTVDFKELSAFITVTSPETTAETIQKYIAKVDRKSDKRLSHEEFETFIIKSLGRHLVFGVPLP